MQDIPDAPYIRFAESRGTDYVFEWLCGENAAGRGERFYEKEKEKEHDYR